MATKFPRLFQNIYMATCTAWVAAVVVVIFAKGWRPHQFNLLYRSWEVLLVYMGTTGPGFLTPIILSFFAIIITLLVIGARQGREAMRNHWQENAATTLLVTLTVLLLVYGPIYTWKVAETVYKDHQELIATRDSLRSENGILKKKSDDDDSALADIKKRKPAVKDQCWMENIILPAPQTIPAARSSIETFMYCNYERKAPLFLEVDYDKPPLSYGPIQFPEGRIQLLDMQTREKSVFYTIQSPSILPFQPFLVTAYGQDANPPRATQTHITTINPER
jgi:hypothetical protein